jgi:multisubunit Na+/H+ antiporter MnhF subunit
LKVIINLILITIPPYTAFFGPSPLNIYFVSIFIYLINKYSLELIDFSHLESRLIGFYIFAICTIFLGFETFDCYIHTYTDRYNININITFNIIFNIVLVLYMQLNLHIGFDFIYFIEISFVHTIVVSKFRTWKQNSTFNEL